MFELLTLASLSGDPQAKIVYSISTDVPANLKGMSDAYAADNKANSAITHGGIAPGGTYTGQAFAYAVDTGTVLQQYTAGSANAFGSALYYAPTDHVIYTGAIWANGPQSAASYSQGCWFRPITGAGGWTAAGGDWPLVDGKMWKGFGAAASPTAMYFFGGFNHQGSFYVTNAVYKLVGTGTTYTVTQPVRMPYAAQGVGVVYHDDYFYIYGGTQGAGRLKFMYRMDPTDHTFVKLPDMPVGVTGCPGIVVNGHIVFLSRSAQNDNCVIVAYKIETREYITLEIPYVYRSGYSALHFGGKAKFVCGVAAFWSRPFGSGNLNADREYASYNMSTHIQDAIVVDIVL